MSNEEQVELACFVEIMKTSGRLMRAMTLWQRIWLWRTYRRLQANYDSAWNGFVELWKVNLRRDK